MFNCTTALHLYFKFRYHTNLAKYVAIYTVHGIIIATSCKGFYLKSSLTSPS